MEEVMVASECTVDATLAHRGCRADFIHESTATCMIARRAAAAEQKRQMGSRMPEIPQDDRFPANRAAIGLVQNLAVSGHTLESVGGECCGCMCARNAIHLH